MSEAFQYGWENHALWLALYGLGAFLLAWLLRWLFWERGRTNVVETSDVEKRLRTKNNDLEKDLASERYKVEELDKQLASLRAKLNICEADKAILESKLAKGSIVASSGVAPNLSYDNLIESSNLQIIEGVGEGTERAFNEAGIMTWADIEATDEDRLKEILAANSISLVGHDVASWKKQAKLANDGNWEVLTNYQKEIDVKNGATGVASKAERIAMQKAGFGASSHNDFEFVKGINKETEDALKAAGINSWSDLAAADDAELRNILDHANIEYDEANLETWSSQASMAINGDWGGLRTMQGGVLVSNMASTSDAEDAQINYNELLSEHDLKIVEGIGGKTELALKAAGISSWTDLANADEADIVTALDEAGIRYEEDAIDSWKYQAKLASESKWDSLFQHQKDLDAEKPGITGESSKAERMALRNMGFPSSKSDLSVVQGLDPKAQAILKESGINNWQQLSASNPEALKQVLSNAGYNYEEANVDSWASQASLATSGNWGKLKAYQTEQHGKSVEENGLIALRGINDDAIKTLEANGIGSIEALADADNYTLYEAFGGKDSQYNWYYLRNQARYARDGQWTAFEGYQSDSFALAFRPDNLEVIEGIGPKTQTLLNDNGIITWAQLADKSPEELQVILEKGGKSYKMHDPKSWPKQARLADDNKWEDLVKYQKFLDSGRETVGNFNSPSKVEKMMIKILGVVSNPDDLKVVEGIGPKIEELLKNNKINDWSDLAKTSVDRLKEILAKEGDRYRLAIPDTWPRQAELADAGKWIELKEYQDFLQGGVDPSK